MILISQKKTTFIVEFKIVTANIWSELVIYLGRYQESTAYC